MPEDLQGGSIICVLMQLGICFCLSLYSILSIEMTTHFKLFSLSLSQKNMCCFETGKYSCKDDVKKMCAAYAGCEALVEGVPLGAAEEDEE